MAGTGRHGDRAVAKNRGRVALVGSSGGHLTHLLALREFWAPLDRFWVTFDTPDAVSRLAGERTYWCHHPTNRNIPLNLDPQYLAERCASCAESGPMPLSPRAQQSRCHSSGSAACSSAQEPSTSRSSTGSTRRRSLAGWCDRWQRPCSCSGPSSVRRIHEEAWWGRSCDPCRVGNTSTADGRTADPARSARRKRCPRGTRGRAIGGIQLPPAESPDVGHRRRRRAGPADCRCGRRDQPRWSGHSRLGPMPPGRVPVVVPRRHASGEHVDDHQVRYARHLATQPGYEVVFDLADLPAAIERARSAAPGAMVPDRSAAIAALRRLTGCG